MLSGLLLATVLGCASSSPTVSASQKASDAELKEARVLYKSGRFMDADRKVRGVLQKDPTNMKAIEFKRLLDKANPGHVDVIR